MYANKANNWREGEKDGGGKEDEYLAYWSEIEGVRWKFVLSRNVDHAKYMWK